MHPDLVISFEIDFAASGSSRTPLIQVKLSTGRDTTAGHSR